MPRAIEWTKTGGKTHRVVITSDEPVCPLWRAMQNTNPTLGYEMIGNAYNSTAWHELMVRQAPNLDARSHISVVGVGTLSGIFGAIF